MDEERIPNDRGKALIRTIGGWGVQNRAREFLIASSRRDVTLSVPRSAPPTREFGVEMNSNVYELLFEREKIPRWKSLSISNSIVREKHEVLFRNNVHTRDFCETLIRDIKLKI